MWVVSSIVITAIVVLTSGLAKHYTHRIGRQFVKRMHREVFEKLLNRKNESTNTQSQVVFVLNLLLDGNFKGLDVYISKNEYV